MVVLNLPSYFTMPLNSVILVGAFILVIAPVLHILLNSYLGRLITPLASWILSGRI